MASPTMGSVARGSTEHLHAEAHFKAHSPYGLPIVDHCQSCELRKAGFFCSLSRETVQAVDQIKHTTSYPEGALVCVEGQAARGVYILCAGRAKLLTTNPEGKTLILKIVQPGEILGLHSVMSGRPYEFTVETLQPAQVAFIAAEDFLRLLKTHGDACLKATVHLSQDCQSAYRLIRSIGLCSSASEKLARLLLEWAAQGQPSNGAVRVKLSLTHEEIAQLSGISRETVTRTLGEFRKHGVIELNGSTLLLRSKAALERMAAY